jgi:circadian clock protein KaiC
MTKKTDIARIETGIRNLDELFHGGIPQGSVVVIGGAPGTGKTILAQQICFHAASARQRVLYFNTLSEPTAKTLRYLSQFSFFNARKLDAGGVHFIDLGAILRTKGLDEAAKLIMERIRRIKPAIVVIDSFKAFDDLAKFWEDLRKFGYELAVNLMAWEATSFLLGEYGPDDIADNPLFSIIDGLVLMTHREQSGEQQRFLQVVKMRGTGHSRDQHAFVIGADGIEVFAPRVTIRREDRGAGVARCRTGIPKLDDLLGDGIPRGSSLLIAGVAGTGKTVLCLEFLYRGAAAGEKGIIFSFEETEERLRATARGLGWDLDREIARGMVEIAFIPQPDIMVEGHLLMMRERIEALPARRVAVDSVSVFLHKVREPQIAREKIFQLASIIQNVQAVGFFATDIPYVEVYKLRNTAHLKGRHNMVIGPGGIMVFPRYEVDVALHQPPPPLETSRRLATGVPGLDALCGGGLLERSVTLVSGSPGIGKSTLGLQFLVAGAERKEPGLYVALEEGPEQIRAAAEGLGLPLEAAIGEGLVELAYLSREQARASQFLAVLDDRIRAQRTRRLVLDGVGHMARGGALPEELRQLLYAMAVRFKARGVTSLFTLEAGSMHSIETITERDYSPIADNILMLRYAREPGELRPTLSVVKTRGSAHDWGTYSFRIQTGGIHIGERMDGGAAQAPGRGRARRRGKT